MSTTSSAPVISPERLATAYSYATYRQLIDEVLAEGHTTGPQQSEQLTEYTVLNVQRMSRLVCIQDFLTKAWAMSVLTQPPFSDFHLRQ